MDVYGTSEEHFGAIAVAQREFASLNPMAILREPLCLDDYLASRFISEPLRLLDCDLPVDGAGAVILTTAERARDLRAVPAHLESWALGTGPRPDRFQWDDLTTSGSRYAAAELWRRSDFGPADVDTAQLYDGFTILTLQWLEALGFCAAGEGGPFVAEGHTRLGGRLPTNTNGGMLNLGRVHGISHVIEAVLQLRDVCGPRQTPGARVAVAANGGGPNAGCVVLYRD
jgi:acetyl-CoA acetyltransferase